MPKCEYCTAAQLGNATLARACTCSAETEEQRLQGRLDAILARDRRLQSLTGCNCDIFPEGCPVCRSIGAALRAERTVGAQMGRAESVNWLLTQADRYEGATYAALKRIAGEFSVSMNTPCLTFDQKLDEACKEICNEGRTVFTRLLKKGFWSTSAMQKVLTKILEKEVV